MKILGIIFLGLAGVYVLVAFGLYFFQESLVFQSTKLEQEYSFEFDSAFEEIDLKTKDGAVLNALHFKVEKPKGVILYFHGNAGDLSRWGNIVEPFLDYNYDVLVMDYRGYGKSIGERSSKKLYLDAELFYREALKHFPEKDIVVYGRSLGTTFATSVAAKFNPKQLILETPFYSFISVVNSIYPIFPTDYLLKYRFPTYQFISKVKCPITIFHGTDDEVVPYENGKRLSKVAPNSVFITIEEGEHNNLGEFEKYWLEIGKVL